MAAVIVLGPLVLALGVVLAITWPEVEVVPMMVAFITAGVVLPIVLYPISYTMWQAVDLVMRPAGPSDFDAVGDESPDPAPRG